MDNLYDYLIGAAPTDTQKQKAVAEQLRRRRSFGELGALTGDRVLQPFGQSMASSADAAAKELQDTRQHDIDNAQTKEYQSGQLQHMKNVEELTRRGQTLDHIYQMMMAEAAQTKADKAGETKIPKLRQGDIKDLQDIAQDIGEFNNLEQYLKSGGKFGAVKVLTDAEGKGGVPIPGMRQLKNLGASMGIGSEEDKTSFAMKQRFDRLYNILARNRLFGATLTANEQKAWNDANPAVRQSDEQIAKALPTLRKVFEHRLGNKARGLMKENYDPAAIAEYADLDSLGMDLEKDSGGHGPVSKRIKVDAEGNVIGD
jgi:hypothetical protein